MRVDQVRTAIEILNARYGYGGVVECVAHSDGVVRFKVVAGTVRERWYKGRVVGNTVYAHSHQLTVK